nr:hypothetical protein [Deltaproteobacteria bacterium]
MNKTIEGGEGFDAFSREVEPRGVDADGYPVGLVVPVVPTAGEARLSMLAANTWEARGIESRAARPRTRRRARRPGGHALAVR